LTDQPFDASLCSIAATEASPMSAKPKTKRIAKWYRDLETVDSAIDDTMEQILKRDGRRAYQDASQNLLTFYCNTIVQMDGGPKRLLGMLRSLDDMYVKTDMHFKKATVKTLRDVPDGI
jgi:hypothetical protein